MRTQLSYVGHHHFRFTCQTTRPLQRPGYRVIAINKRIIANCVLHFLFVPDFHWRISDATRCLLGTTITEISFGLFLPPPMIRRSRIVQPRHSRSQRSPLRPKRARLHKLVIVGVGESFQLVGTGSKHEADGSKCDSDTDEPRSPDHLNPTLMCHHYFGDAIRPVTTRCRSI